MTQGATNEIPSLLDGKVAVVTGAADGIGLAIARTLWGHGARVVLADVRSRAAADAAAALDPDGTTTLGWACDVSSETDVAALVAGAVDRWGHLDVFVNNAGITRDVTLAKMSVADFRQVMEVNLLGTWLGTREALRAMRDQGGAIVNMSSISGKVGNFGQGNYSAAKAGVVALTKVAAREGARHGIRVNAIQPGLIRTGMTAAMPPDVLAAKVAEVPLGRPGEADEVAKVALFLASDLSSYVTGTVVEVAGGRHM